MNAVYKVHPYIPITDRFDINDSIDSSVDIPMLEAWGMNLMRLGVMWEAVETAPGVYNATYLDEIETLINNMGEKGIYTMVDAH
jgi:endoglycosylceramidase